MIAQFSSELGDEERREENHGTIDRWRKTTGVNLEGEAQKAKQKLEDLDKLRRSPD